MQVLMTNTVASPPATRFGRRNLWTVLLLCLSILVLSSWELWSEVEQFRQTAREVDDNSRQAAAAYAELIANRLNTQFVELQSLAVTLLEPSTVAHAPPERTQQILRHFLELHPSLDAFNIQSPDGNHLIWSTRGHEKKVFEPQSYFTPLLANPDFLLGQDLFLPHAHARIIAMRYRIHGTHASFYVGSPYLLDHLLLQQDTSASLLAWRFNVLDARDASLLGSWHQGQLSFGATDIPADGVRVRVPGYPLVVQALAPAGLARQNYLRTAPTRWAFEAASLALMLAAAWSMRRLIRERELQAQQLHEMTAFSTALFDSVGAMTIVSNTAGEIVRFNHAAEAFLGYRFDEVCERPYFWLRFLPEEEREAARAMFATMCQDAEPHLYEHHWISRGGQQRLFAWSSTVLRFSQDAPQFLVTVGLDITARKAMEQELQEHALRLRRLTNFNSMLAQVNQLIASAADEEQLLQGICELVVKFTGIALAFIARPDLEGRFQFPAANGQLEYLDDLYLSTHPDIPEGQGVCGQVWRDQHAHFSALIESEMRLQPWFQRARRLGFQSMAAMPIRRNGQIWAVLTVYHQQDNIFDQDLQALLEELAQDISLGLDHIETQHLQNALLDNSVVGILLIKNRVIQNCNRRMAQMLGRSIAETIGQSSRLLYARGDEDYQRIGATYDELRASGQVRLSSVPVTRKDGSRLICDFSGVLLQNASEELSIWTIEDVTAREEQGQRLQRLALFNALLAEVNQLGAAALDLNSFYAEVCQAATKLSQMQLAWIGSPTESGLFEVLAAHGEVDYLDEVSISSHADMPGGNGPTGRAWREDRPIFIAHYLSNDLQPPWTSHAERYGFGSFAALPLHAQGQVCAVFTVYFGQDNVFDNENQQLLNDLISSIERGQASLEQRHRITLLQGLYHALMSEGEVVLQASSSGEMLQRTCDKLVHGTQFHVAWVGQPDSAGLVQILASAGEGASQLDAMTIDIADFEHSPLVVRAWNEQTLQYNNDHLADPQLAKWSPFLIAHRWHAGLAAPVRRAGEIWGVLVFVSPLRNVFDASTITLCQRVAELLGHGLDELDLKERLNRLQSEEAHRARHDALTNLPNRLALEQYLPQAISRAKRHGSILAVGMIDLDDFKPVNDTWGHEAGDQLLQELALRLQARMREYDFLARLGGDEFVIVIEDLDPLQLTAQLTTLLNRLHGAVEIPFQLAQHAQASLEMSLGLALFPREAEDSDSLLRLADAAMYQAKLHKRQRLQWWRLGASSANEPEREPIFDVYGAEAAILLTKVRESLQIIAKQFVADFYGELQLREQPHDILKNLSPAEMERLQHRQAQHLDFLLDPRTTQAMIQQRARHLGQVHALVGVSAAALSNSMALYRRLLRAHLNQNLLPARERYQLVQAAEARVQEDIQTELQSAQEVSDAYLHTLTQGYPSEHTLWADILPVELDHIAKLPGILACELLHQNAEGVFQVEASAGKVADQVRQILSAPGTQAILDVRQTTGKGLIASAWHSGEITHTAAYANDARTAAWQSEVESLGIRSMLAIPIPRAPQNPVLVLAIQGAYPHQFESTWMHQFATSMQQRWSTIWQRGSSPSQASSLEQETAQSYRQQLFSGGLRMAMQPVVDLRSGRLVKVEALARLHMPDGQVIPPANFLPLLGTTELDGLFRMGLDQALSQLAQWDQQDLSIEMALNLAPSTLLDLDCPRWVEQALHRHGIAPHRLTLELLESEKLSDILQDQAIVQLKLLGVKLAMDDLGSGYSSLQRLSTLPFNTIKIDQSLLLHIRDNPVQTLSLINTIIQMGQDFERDVVVEGLEDADLIEAVTILGAHYGQGYGLGRPMMPEALFDWSRHIPHPTSITEVHSFLGALAYHWKFVHKHFGPQSTPLAACPLTHFFEHKGLEHCEAAAWHTQVHEDSDHREASQKLIEWLERCVREHS